MRKEIQQPLERTVLADVLEKAGYKIKYFGDEIVCRSGRYHFEFRFKKLKTIARGHIDTGIFGIHHKVIYQSKSLDDELNRILSAYRQVVPEI